MHVISDCRITSDHLPITITLKTHNNHNTSQQQSSRVRWKTDANDETWERYREVINQKLPTWTAAWSSRNIPTSTRITQQQINTCYEQLVAIMTSAAEQTIGTVNITGKHQDWWGRDPAIPTLHRAKQKAQREYRYMLKRRAARPNSAPTQAHFESALTAYRKARAEFENAVRACRIKCYEELVASLDDGRHKLIWSMWNRVSGSPRIPLASVHDPNNKSPPLSQQHAIDNMAQFLKHISTATPTTQHDPHEQRMQHEHVMDYLLHVDEQSDIAAPPPFTLDDVIRLCETSRTNTALGSDNVSPHFLRRGGRMLHETMFILLSICSRHGIIPQQLRHAHVMTLYKGEGNTNNPNNYRPISITSIIVRMYERLHMDTLLRHMEAVGIPSISQFGFTKQRSTHDAIYRLLSIIVDVMGTGVGEYVPTVFVDISKAYDKVWIDGLLYKLHHECHITGNLFHMIRALLKGRTMQVVYNNLISTTHELNAGVPQGSVLAPLLFLIFIHALTTQLSPSICQSLFADDIALLPHTSGTAGLVNLRLALDVLSDYATRWKIVFSQKKTQVLFFTPNKRTKQQPPHHTLMLTGFTLTTTRMYTYLGVLLDDRLTFIPHLTRLIQRTTGMSLRLTRMVRRDKLPSFPVIRQLVQCVLVPQMTYAFAFLFGTILDEQVTDIQTDEQHKTKINIHSKLKNNLLRPLRASLQLPFHAHHNSIFTESRMLNIPNLILLSTAQLVHRWLNMRPPVHNAASTLFKHHLNNVDTLPPYHPCVRLCNALATAPLLRFSASQPLTFSSRPKHVVRELIWKHQYEQWHYNHSTSTRPNSLPYHYPPAPVSVSPLPLYLTSEPPAAATRRAKLRFRRAQFGFNMERVGYSVNTTCTHCNAPVEDNDHVLCHCPIHDAARVTCLNALDAMFDPNVPNPMHPITANKLISPDMFLSSFPRLIPSAFSITSSFFKHISLVRPF